METSKWGDDRLDDAFRNIDRRLVSVEGVNTRLATAETELSFIRSDMHECSEGIKGLQQALVERQKAREAERKERERARKADRRWWVGSVFTAAGLVVAALGFLVDKF